MLLVNQLQNSHVHLDLKAVEWDYDLPHSNYPGAATIQDVINPLLGDCQIAVFLFYSRIGPFTRQEFEFATREKKKLFVFFKDGYSPRDKQTYQLFGELIEFKDSLSNSVLYMTYSNPGEYEHAFFSNLNLELSRNHAAITVPADEMAGTLSQSVLELIRMLADKETEIAGLKEILTEKPDTGARQQLAIVEKQKEEISRQLQKSQDIIRLQEKDKMELEQQLQKYEGKNELKKQALEEVEKRNYDKAEALLVESARESISETAANFFELAKIKKLQLQYLEAMNYFELAVKIDLGNADFLYEAGTMAYDLGYYDKAIAYLDRSLALLIKTRIANDYELAMRYTALGISYFRKDDYKKAGQLLEKALAINKKAYGEDHPETAVDITNLGLVYYKNGDYDKAIFMYENALSIVKRYLGEEYQAIAVGYTNLGAAYKEKGDYDIAIDFYQKALEIDNKCLGLGHPDIGIDYYNLGEVYENKNEFSKALDYYDQAMATFSKVLPCDHPFIQMTLKNKARAEMKMKEQ